MLGTWAETAEQCAAKDKTNIVIEPAKYGDSDGSCEVRWIDQPEGSRGINYEVRALCTSASLPENHNRKRRFRAAAQIPIKSAVKEMISISSMVLQ